MACRGTRRAAAVKKKIVDLDSDAFSVRERATTELAELGDVAEAQEVLEAMAAGRLGADLARDAKEALGRLEKRAARP
jgi:hypothetical protein